MWLKRPDPLLRGGIGPEIQRFKDAENLRPLLLDLVTLSVNNHSCVCERFLILQDVSSYATTGCLIDA